MANWLQAVWEKPVGWHNAAPRGSWQAFGELTSPSGVGDDNFTLAVGQPEWRFKLTACFLEQLS
jgi:hypothetical protein